MASPLRRVLPRLGLALAALAATLLAVEGVASALAGRLLLTPLVRARLASPPAATDVFAQRSEAPGPARPGPGAAAPAEGVYRVHPDPLVGYTLRLSRQLAVFDAPVHSDALGLRTTPGPPPAPDAPRVAILGDSVAFGYGLRGEETIAARLGVLLGASRGPGEPPVACRTVAMPGWNHANAVHFLLDHLDALAPDIVVYVPVGNDLLDTDGMDEHGLRHAAPDIAQRDPWLSLYQGASLAWLKPMLHEVLSDPDAAAARLGPWVLESDLTPESSTRFDAQVASVALLSARLAERGARLLVAPYVESTQTWILAERLLAVRPEVPLLPLFSGVPPEFTLGRDPHPNALTATVMASWIAAELLARGWVSPGAGRPLPAVDAAHQAKRARLHPPQELAALCDGLRARARGQLLGTLDTRTADGLAQVYGGLNEDGSVGMRLSFVIARPAGAAALELELAPIAARPDLCPLAVTVEANGVPLGSLQVQPGESATIARFALPPEAAPTDPARTTETALPPLEVRLVPERWVTASVRGRDVPVSFRPLRMACVRR